MKKGILYGIGAYLLWGVFPIYWKWLHTVPAIQVISHRIIWSFLLLALILFVTRQWKAFRSAALSRRVVLIYLASAILLSINWLTYVWAVNAGFIVETSLGYFINPLMSVLLGVIFLRETPAPVAVGADRAGGHRRDLRGLFLRAVPLDRADTGLFLWDLWTDQKDRPAGFAVWVDAGDGPAFPPGGRIPDLYGKAWGRGHSCTAVPSWTC